MVEEDINKEEKALVRKVLLEIKEKKRKANRLITKKQIECSDELLVLMPFNILYNANRAIIGLTNPIYLYDLIIVLESLVLFDKIIVLPSDDIDRLEEKTSENNFLLTLLDRKKLYFLDINFNEISKNKVRDILRTAKYGDFIKYITKNYPKISNLYGINNSNIEYLDSTFPAPSAGNYLSQYNFLRLKAGEIINLNNL